MSELKAFINPNDTDYHKERQEFAKLLYENLDMLPHRYVLVLTNLCNLKCSFCFQEKKYIHGSMTTEDWIAVIDQLPKYAWVTLTGGEPFVFKDFEKIFRHLTDRFKCNIISNGLLLNEKRIDMLLGCKNFKILSISVDDIGNKARDVHPKKWKIAEDMMRLFIKKRNALNSETLLDVKTVVLDEHAHDLFDIYKYCVEDLMCDTHSFQLLKGSPMQHADYMFPFDDMFNKSEAYVYKNWNIICEQFEKVRQYNVANQKRSFLHPKIGDLTTDKPIHHSTLDYINKKDYIPQNYHTCKAPWESLHINVDGNLFPCMAIEMGNVKEEGLKEIIQGDAYSKFKDTISKCGTVEACNRCGYLRPNVPVIN